MVFNRIVKRSIILLEKNPGNNSDYIIIKRKYVFKQNFFFGRTLLHKYDIQIK
jgi:hypothetical protein